jgi:hypothetical protein
MAAPLSEGAHLNNMLRAAGLTALTNLDGSMIYIWPGNRIPGEILAYMIADRSRPDALARYLINLGRDIV